MVHSYVEALPQENHGGPNYFDITKEKQVSNCPQAGRLCRKRFGKPMSKVVKLSSPQCNGGKQQHCTE